MLHLNDTYWECKMFKTAKITQHQNNQIYKPLLVDCAHIPFKSLVMRQQDYVIFQNDRHYHSSPDSVSKRGKAYQSWLIQKQ